MILLNMEFQFGKIQNKETGVKLVKTSIFFIIITLFAIGCGKKEAEPKIEIRFGVLPALQALPLYVASDKGFFEEAGVNVAIVKFNTAAEKDIAMASGALDGQFADLFTPAVIEDGGQDVSIVAANYNTKTGGRMFAILGKPGGGYTTAQDLAGTPIALSSNTVIDYVTERLLMDNGLSQDQIEKVESKNIGLRMQMLLSGQVEAATLPEPLATAALKNNATLAADDAGMVESQTVLVFRDDFTVERASEVKLFLQGVDKAQIYINEYPDSTRQIMMEHIRLPEQLKESFPIPRFPKLHTPDSLTVANVVEWLHDKGAIENKPVYMELVDGKYLD